MQWTRFIFAALHGLMAKAGGWGGGEGSPLELQQGLRVPGRWPWQPPWDGARACHASSTLGADPWHQTPNPLREEMLCAGDRLVSGGTVHARSWASVIWELGWKTSH